MRTIHAFVASVAVAGLPFAARADAPPSAAPSDPVTRAGRVLAEIEAGTFDRGQLTPELAGELSAAQLASLRARLIPLGSPQAMTLRAKADDGTVATYTIRVAFAAGTLDYVFGVDDASAKIAKLYVVPGPP